MSTSGQPDKTSADKDPQASTDDAPFVPLSRGEQVAALGEAGVMGMFVGLLLFVLGATIGLTQQKPWITIAGFLVGGGIAAWCGYLGMRDGRLHDLPRHFTMGKRSLIIGVLLLALGLLRWIMLGS